LISCDSKPFRIALLGPPASGKGTQGKHLATRLGLSYLSTGALLREHVENKTTLGLAAAPILLRGEYLPDELMFPIVAEWLEAQPSGWVLDGFPRSLPQALFLDQWLRDHSFTLSAAVSLEVPFDALLSRMRQRVECPQCRWTGNLSQLAEGGKCPVCGSIATRRADDDEANFRRRYAEFENLTLPVIRHYGSEDLLLSCDAAAPPTEVAERLLSHFNTAV